jgi:hypothetical protein
MRAVKRMKNVKHAMKNEKTEGSHGAGARRRFHSSFYIACFTFFISALPADPQPRPSPEVPEEGE